MTANARNSASHEYLDHTGFPTRGNIGQLAPMPIVIPHLDSEREAKGQRRPCLAPRGPHDSRAAPNGTGRADPVDRNAVVLILLSDG